MILELIFQTKKIDHTTKQGCHYNSKLPGKYSKWVGNQTARGFFWLYFSSIFLWMWPGAKFIVAGGNPRPPPLNDSPAQRKRKVFTHLWITSIITSISVGIMACASCTVYFPSNLWIGRWRWQRYWKRSGCKWWHWWLKQDRLILAKK